MGEEKGKGGTIKVVRRGKGFFQSLKKKGNSGVVARLSKRKTSKKKWSLRPIKGRRRGGED